MHTARVTIQTADFDLSAEVAALRAGDPGVGAVAAFVGTVRDRSDGQGVSAMELEHYPGMTEQAITAMSKRTIASAPCSRRTRSCSSRSPRRTGPRPSRPANS